MFFRKKREEKESKEIVSPLNGKLFPIETVQDDVFAQQMMGQTIALEPLKGKDTLLSPADGVLEVMYPTGHAYAVKMKNGMGLLIHIGIDTVELNGEGFTVLAKQGEKIKMGQPIVDVDFDTLKAKGFDVSVMLIVTQNPGGEPIAFKQNMTVNAMESSVL